MSLPKPGIWDADPSNDDVLVLVDVGMFWYQFWPAPQPAQWVFWFQLNRALTPSDDVWLLQCGLPTKTTVELVGRKGIRHTTSQWRYPTITKFPFVQIDYPVSFSPPIYTAPGNTDDSWHLNPWTAVCSRVSQNPDKFISLGPAYFQGRPFYRYPESEVDIGPKP